MRFSTLPAVLLLLLSLVAPTAWAAPILTLRQGTSATQTLYYTDGDGIVTIAGPIGSAVLITAGGSTASAGNAARDLLAFNLTTATKAAIQLKGSGNVLRNRPVPTKTVPEPGSLGLLAVGLFAARVLARRRAASRI